MRNKVLIGASVAALGFLVWGLEGLILAAMVAALLAVPNRKSKKYVIRFVA